MMMKRAFITGVTGQDGAYLTQLLLQRGYRVFGGYRRSASLNTWRLHELGVLDHPNFTLTPFDLTDPTAAIRLVQELRPNEIYNLAAQSFVGVSFEQPTATTMASGVGCLNLLEAIRMIDPSIRFYQASTSEMYGLVQAVPQSEATPFYPRSPYGVAKLYAHWMTVNYRESYDLFASSGILFNHESPLRGLEFVTRKITDGVAQILAGSLECLHLGNLDAKRDWGYAAEYVQGMHQMLQVDQPDTFVLATNDTVSVREFARLAFLAAGLDLEFEGTGIDEIGVDRASGQVMIRIHPDFFRPAEVDLLIGDATKAEQKLGWRASTSMQSLCEMMVAADLKRHNVTARKPMTAAPAKAIA